MIIFDYDIHLFGSLLIALGLDYFLLSFTFNETILFYLFIALGALLPDMDTPESSIGKYLRPLSDIINIVFGHRKLFHSMLFWTVIYIVVTFMSNGVTVIPTALMIGITLHILGDMIDGTVPVAYPISRKCIGLNIRYDE